MNIFKNFLNTKSAPIQKKSFFSVIGQHFNNYLGGDDRELLNQYKGWVYRCVDIISNEVASIAIKLYDGDKEVKNHEIQQLLNRVNPVMSQSDLIKATQSFLSLHGDAFWYLSREKETNGEIKELWPLRPDWVKIVVSKEGEITNYKYGPGREKTDYKVENIIPFINFNPKFFNNKNPFRGVGDVEAALATIYEDEYIKKWNRNLLKNGARIDGVLEYDGEMNAEDQKNLEDKWNQEYTGERNTGKTAILTAGLKYNKIGIDHNALDFIEQKKLNRDDIFLLLGVPKGLMIADDVNRANARAALYPFLRFTIRPKIVKIVDTLNEFLLPKLNNTGKLEFKFDDPVPEDREAKLAEYDKAVNRWMTINEIRARERLEKIKNGDKLYIPFSMIELGDESDKKDEDKEDKNFVIRIKETKSAYDELSKGQKKRIDNYLITGREFEKKYKKEIIKWFKKMEKEAFDLIGGEKTLNKGVDDIFSKLKEFAGKYFGIFLPINKTILTLIGKDAFEDLDIDGEFNENEERIEKYLKKMTKKAGDVITDETIKKLSEKVAEKVGEGASLSEIRDEISKVFTSATTVRADRIARSETFRTLNEGKLEAWRQSGVVAKKKWITIKDELTCPFCAEMDGKIIGLDNNYFNLNDILTVGDEDLSFDYTAIAGGALHTNCRCTIVPILGNKNFKAFKAKEENEYFNEILNIVNEIKENE